MPRRRPQPATRRREQPRPLNELTKLRRDVAFGRAAHCLQNLRSGVKACLMREAIKGGNQTLSTISRNQHQLNGNQSQSQYKQPHSQGTQP